jgi:hypothetical protein
MTVTFCLANAAFITNNDALLIPNASLRVTNDALSIVNVAFRERNDALFKHKEAPRTTNDAFHKHKAALLTQSAAFLNRNDEVALATFHPTGDPGNSTMPNPILPRDRGCAVR